MARAYSRRQASRSPTSSTTPSSAAKMNGQYEPLPPFFDDVVGSLEVVVAAAGRISASLTPSAGSAADPLEVALGFELALRAVLADVVAVDCVGAGCE